LSVCKVASSVLVFLVMINACMTAVHIYFANANGAGMIYANAEEGYTGQFSNLTNYIGDLAVNGSEKLLIRDCEFNITGQITISDQAQRMLQRQKHQDPYSGFPSESLSLSVRVFKRIPTSFTRNCLLTKHTTTCSSLISPESLTRACHCL
jgi:hypothetical protein